MIVLKQEFKQLIAQLIIQKQQQINQSAFHSHHQQPNSNIISQHNQDSNQSLSHRQQVMMNKASPQQQQQAGVTDSVVQSEQHNNRLNTNQSGSNRQKDDEQDEYHQQQQQLQLQSPTCIVTKSQIHNLLKSRPFFEILHTNQGLLALQSYYIKALLLSEQQLCNNLYDGAASTPFLSALASVKYQNIIQQQQQQQQSAISSHPYLNSYHLETTSFSTPFRTASAQPQFTFASDAFSFSKILSSVLDIKSTQSQHSNAQYDSNFALNRDELLLDCIHALDPCGTDTFGIKQFAILLYFYAAQEDGFLLHCLYKFGIAIYNMISAKQQSLSGDRMKILGRLLGVSQRQMIVTSHELAISTYSIIGGKEFVMFYYELFKNVEQERIDTLQADIIVQEKIRSGGKGMKRTGKFGGNNMANLQDEIDDSSQLLSEQQQLSHRMKKNNAGSRNNRYKSEEELNTQISCFQVGKSNNSKIKKIKNKQERQLNDQLDDDSEKAQSQQELHQSQNMQSNRNNNGLIKNKNKQSIKNINNDKKSVQKVGEQGQCCSKNKCQIF